MASAVSQGHGPWTLLKRALGLDRKPVSDPRPPRPAAYADYWALQQRKDPRTAPIKK